MKGIFVILLFVCCSALQACSTNMPCCGQKIAISDSTNTPCSGRKGGISHCIGSTFVCNDGSTSASTKNCSAYMCSRSRSTSGMTPAIGYCSCRSGSYCVGPRGGHYCYTDSGHKNYLKRY